MQRRARLSALDRGESLRFVGRVPTDPVAALADRMRDDCVGAVDVDEVAAILEANGINDRVADREYGVPSVFALAGRVVARTLDTADTSCTRAPIDEGPAARAVVTDTLIRADDLPDPAGDRRSARRPKWTVRRGLATTGTLLLGWGGGQALSYLGYRALSERGRHRRRPAARRRLPRPRRACGALALAGGTGPRAYIVAAVQLALFAVAAVALVTSRERVVLAAAAPCWLATAAVAAGLGGWAVTALLVRGRRAAGRRVPARRRRRRQRPDAARGAGGPGAATSATPLLYGLVGTGQAALLRPSPSTGSRRTGCPSRRCRCWSGCR